MVYFSEEVEQGIREKVADGTVKTEEHLLLWKGLLFLLWSLIQSKAYATTNAFISAPIMLVSCGTRFIPQKLYDLLWKIP